MQRNNLYCTILDNSISNPADRYSIIAARCLGTNRNFPWIASGNGGFETRRRIDLHFDIFISTGKRPTNLLASGYQEKLAAGSSIRDEISESAYAI
jgi:hypothetical protein